MMNWVQILALHIYFERDNNGDWNEIAKLTADDGSPFESFGASVSLVEDWALIGAPDDDDEVKGENTARNF